MAVVAALDTVKAFLAVDTVDIVAVAMARFVAVD